MNESILCSSLNLGKISFDLINFCHILLEGSPIPFCMYRFCRRIESCVAFLRYFFLMDLVSSFEMQLIMTSSFYISLVGR